MGLYWVNGRLCIPVCLLTSFFFFLLSHYGCCAGDTVIIIIIIIIISLCILTFIHSGRVNWVS